MSLAELIAANPSGTIDLNGDHDENSDFDMVDGTCDLNHELALLNRISYDISVVHDLDGMYHSIETVPVKASEAPGSILYVLLTSGVFHRVRLKAKTSRQGWHVRFCEATMVYEGQES